MDFFNKKYGKKNKKNNRNVAASNFSNMVLEDLEDAISSVNGNIFKPVPYWVTWHPINVK